MEGRKRKKNKRKEGRNKRTNVRTKKRKKGRGNFPLISRKSLGRFYSANVLTRYEKGPIE